MEGKKMKKMFIVLAVIGLMCLSSVAHASLWDPYIIRADSYGVSPIIQDNNDYGTAAKEFITYLGGQKAGWGNNDLSGRKVGDIAEISITRLDDYTRFASGSGPAVAPYFNIWITDGTHFAVIANEPSNGEWQPGNNQWDMTWDTLKTKTLKVYEITDKSWLPNSGVGLTFYDLRNYTIEAPTVAQLTTGWTGLGTGAPRELGTNEAYAFNWIFGDTLSNYVSGSEGYVVANPVASPVPIPAAVYLLGTGLVGLFGIRRRLAS
jgi:hypothetical protein